MISLFYSVNYLVQTLFSYSCFNFKQKIAIISCAELFVKDSNYFQVLSIRVYEEIDCLQATGESRALRELETNLDAKVRGQLYASSGEVTHLYLSPNDVRCYGDRRVGAIINTHCCDAVQPGKWLQDVVVVVRGAQTFAPKLDFIIQVVGVGQQIGESEGNPSSDEREIKER